MDGLPVLRKIFLIVGFIYTKHSGDSQQCISSPALVIYGSLIILTTIIFNVITLISDFAPTLEAKVLVDQNHVLIGMFAVITSFALLLTMSATTGIGIVLKRNRQTELFTHFYRIRYNFLYPLITKKFRF